MNAERSDGLDPDQDEEVFQDASSASPELPGPNLRRSTRKRKSVSNDLDTGSKTEGSVGKRHRPLGTPTSQHKTMHRSPTQNQPRRATGKQPPVINIETDPPTNATNTGGSEQLVLLSGLRSVLREELEKTEDKLTERMKSVEQGFLGLKDDVRTLETRVDGLERRMDEKVEGIVADIIKSNASQPGPDRRMDLMNAQQTRYWKSRRSLRLWPISGDGAQALRASLVDFLRNKLKLGEEEVAEAESVDIRKIPRSQNSKIVNEVAVDFHSVELRDVVRAAAFNLAPFPNCGIRLEVAHHLMNNFKSLSTASFKLQKRFPLCKRNIKYDDERCDLVLDFKTGPDHPWKKVRPDQAKTLTGGDAFDEVSASDLTDLLEGGSDDEDDLEKQA